MIDGYLTRWKEFEGLTIVRAVANNDGDVYLTFDNDCRAVVESEWAYDGNYDYGLGSPLSNPYELHKAGWLSKELLEQHQKEQNEIWEKVKENRERLELAALKAKYE